MPETLGPKVPHPAGCYWLLQHSPAGNSWLATGGMIWIPQLQYASFLVDGCELYTRRTARAIMCCIKPWLLVFAVHFQHAVLLCCAMVRSVRQVIIRQRS